MTKAFSILHRAAALLVALCLLVGMALPVYAAEDGALFFNAGSETIPTIPAANTSSEGVEPAQEPIVSDLETIPGEGDTPPTANEPGTEAGNTVNNTAAVPNNDGKTQEAAENQTPAADTDTAPADPALTDKTPADTPDTAAAPNHAINAEKTTAAKNNTEQDVLFADEDNPNEEDTMLADDLPDNDDANTADTIADTSVSTGFIPATTTIYFEDDGRYDSTYNGNCTMRFLGFTGNGKEAYINKVMVDTGTTVTGKDGKNHKIFSITLNSADYPAGGFYRIAFQYYDGSNSTWQEEINAFGRDDGVNNDYLTAIDLLAGKKFVREGITISDQQGKHFNQNQHYNPSQWTRVEYYYKDTPLYFKNESDAALTDVTATFYKLEKYDANKAGNDHVAYTYRVLERATADGKFYGGADGDVIEINGKKYKVLNTTVTGDSADKTLTLTNQLQDAKYNLVITKQDAQDAGIKLGGVEFKLEKPDAELSETKTGKTAEETGELTFADLTPGSYRLTETKTAEGYTLLAEPIEFTLTADGQCRRGDETFGKITPGADGVYNIALTVYNRKGFTLPHTGADAPSLWLLIGLPALVAVLLVLVFRYNKKGGRRS